MTASMPLVILMHDFADEKLTSKYDGCSAVFVKDYVPKERFSKYMKLGFRHSILIRKSSESHCYGKFAQERGMIISERCILGTV